MLEKEIEESLPVTCLYEKPDIGIHEADGHGDILPVRENGFAIGAALFDEAEDIIPSMDRCWV